MMDFSFEQSPWELYFEKLHAGSVQASVLLSLLEGESEEALEAAFQDLEQAGITLDIDALPAPALGGEMGQRLSLEEKLAKNGLTVTSFPEDDPLGMYLLELAGIPACGDIRLLSLELAVANRAGRDAADLRSMVMNLSLSRVVELAAAHTGRGVLLLDLIQEGSLGLWQIICTFEGDDFEAQRDWWIRQYMAKAVTLQARSSGVGERMRALMEAYREADRALLTRLGRNPVLEEIALELRMKPEDALQVEQMVLTAKLIDQAKQDGKPQDQPQEEDQDVENTAYFQSRQRIQELLSALTPEDAKLLTMRFGLEGGLPLSPEETGRKLGLTPEEVVAREAAALELLRRER